MKLPKNRVFFSSREFDCVQPQPVLVTENYKAQL